MKHLEIRLTGDRGALGCQRGLDDVAVSELEMGSTLEKHGYPRCLEIQQASWFLGISKQELAVSEVRVTGKPVNPDKNTGCYRLNRKAG